MNTFNSIKIALFATTLISSTTFAHDLTIIVDNISENKGTMMVALHNTADGFKKTTNDVSAQRMKVTTPTMTFHFTNLPEGDYAVKLYQDSNDNNRIDLSDNSIPLEAFGFSNNVGQRGRPTFDDAKFSLSHDDQITVHLQSVN